MNEINRLAKEIASTRDALARIEARNDLSRASILVDGTSRSLTDALRDIGKLANNLAETVEDLKATKALADSKIAYTAGVRPAAPDVGDLHRDTDGTVVQWDGNTWVPVDSAATLALASDLGDLSTEVDKKREVFYAPTEPTTGADNDLWLRSTDNRLHIRVGGAWVEAQDNAIAAATSTAQSAQEAATHAAGTLVTENLLSNSMFLPHWSVTSYQSVYFSYTGGSATGSLKDTPAVPGPLRGHRYMRCTTSGGATKAKIWHDSDIALPSGTVISAGAWVLVSKPTRVQCGYRRHSLTARDANALFTYDVVQVPASQWVWVEPGPHTTDGEWCWGISVSTLDDTDVELWVQGPTLGVGQRCPTWAPRLAETANLSDPTPSKNSNMTLFRRAYGTTARSPIGCLGWGDESYWTSSTGADGGNLVFTAPDDTSSAIRSNQKWVGGPLWGISLDVTHLTIELDVTVHAGNFSGAGYRMGWGDGNGNRFTDLNLHAAMPQPALGQRYAFRHTVTKPADKGTITNLYGYLFGNHSTMGTKTAKTLTFHRFVVRPSTEGEIDALASTGKSKVTYSSAAPSGTTHKDNDLWFQTDPNRDNNVKSLSVYTNGAWQQKQLLDDVVNSITANKVTTGTLQAAHYIKAGLAEMHGTHGFRTFKTDGSIACSLGMSGADALRVTKSDGILDAFSVDGTNGDVYIGGDIDVVGATNFRERTRENRQIGSLRTALDSKPRGVVARRDYIGNSSMSTGTLHLFNFQCVVYSNRSYTIRLSSSRVAFSNNNDNAKVFVTYQLGSVVSYASGPPSAPSISSSSPTMMAHWQPGHSGMSTGVIERLWSDSMGAPSSDPWSKKRTLRLGLYIKRDYGSGSVGFLSGGDCPIELIVRDDGPFVYES